MTDNLNKLLSDLSIKFALTGILDFNPVVTSSIRWVKWLTTLTFGTCIYCARQNGKILEKNSPSYKKPPVHFNCRCKLKELTAIIAGTATINKTAGADYTIKHNRCLPDNYITKREAVKKGWINQKGNLHKVLPNRIIGGDVYYDFNQVLPSAPGRIWYEADINYTHGYRNEHRLVYSNDGLIFVTYDHYKTLCEIR